MRKAQVALEYLITYGWGFLAILVVVGALAYFGYLTPTKYLPARCDFGAQLSCLDYGLVQTADNGCVLLQFRNNFGDGIRVHGIETFDGEGALSYGATPDCGGAAVGAYVTITKSNVSQIFSLDVSSSSEEIFVAGERMSLPLRVTFSRDRDGAPLHNLSGEIYATVVS